MAKEKVIKGCKADHKTPQRDKFFGYVCQVRNAMTLLVYHHEDEQQRLEVIAHGVARDFGKDIDQPKTHQFVRKPHDYTEHRVFQVIVDAQI